MFVQRWLNRLDQQNRQWFADGARAIAPATVAVGLWGFVTGVAMVKAGLTQYEALVMSLVVYAGSAQLTALPLIMTGAPVWLIFLAGMMVNIRFVIFGAAMFPYFRSLSWPRRLWAGFFNGDLHTGIICCVVSLRKLCFFRRTRAGREQHSTQKRKDNREKHP